jgi:hypothetical protein
MTAVGYISDNEEIVKASWSCFEGDGAAAFTLSEKSHVLPAVSANDLPGGRTQILNVRQISLVNCHPAECDEDSSPESFADTENGHNWKKDPDNPNECDDDLEATNESEMQLDNASEDSETPEQQNGSAAPNVPGWIRPIHRIKKIVELLLMKVNIMETRRNKGIKNK